MYAYNVSIDNMLDVSNPQVRQQLGINLDDILNDVYKDYKLNNGSSTTHNWKICNR